MAPLARIRLLVVNAHAPGRVLARPNGLAGLALPAAARDRSVDAAWTEADAARAASVLGADVTAARHLGGDLWTVTVAGRVPRVGNQWVGVEELGRLGVDAAAVRAVADEWASGRGQASS